MRNKTNHTPLTRGSRLTDAKLLLIITICVFVVMYLCAVLFLGSGFKKPQTFFNILNENAALLILSCGMSLVMITGGIDISVGTLTALVCMSCAVNLDFHGGTVLTAILLALGIGTAFGLVQGFLIAYLEIQPFIVTLAGMFFAKGMTTIVNATQFNVENEAFKALKETRIYVPGMGSVNKLGAYVPAYVEIGVVVALVVVAVLFVVLRWTRFGRSVYAVGGNSYSANMLAINVKLLIFLTAAFAIGGTLKSCGVADRLFSLFVPVFPQTFSPAYAAVVLLTVVLLHTVLGSNITTMSVVVPGLMSIGAGVAPPLPLMFLICIAVCSQFLLPFHHVILLLGEGDRCYSTHELLRVGIPHTALMLFAVFLLYLPWWRLLGAL